MRRKVLNCITLCQAFLIPFYLFRLVRRPLTDLERFLTTLYTSCSEYVCYFFRILRDFKKFYFKRCLFVLFECFSKKFYFVTDGNDKVLHYNNLGFR